MHITSFCWTPTESGLQVDHTQSVCCSLQTDFMVLTSTNIHHTISDSHIPKPSSPTSVMFPRSSLMVISSGRLWLTANWACTSISLGQKQTTKH